MMRPSMMTTSPPPSKPDIVLWPGTNGSANAALPSGTMSVMASHSTLEPPYFRIRIMKTL
jgi:hypothetical protein